jgi:hypothetical protein
MDGWMDGWMDRCCVCRMTGKPRLNIIACMHACIHSFVSSSSAKVDNIMVEQ